MRIILAALMCLGAGALGCGGSELRPDQQKEYDRLQDERRDIGGRIGQANRRADRAFRDLGAAEKRKKRAFRHVVLCGAKADGQTFDSTFAGKKKVKLKPSGSIKVSGKSCKYYKFGVVK